MSVPQLGSSIPISGNSVPVCGNSVPVSGNIVPVSGNIVPVCGNSVPVSGNSIPVSGNIVPVSGNSIPVSGNIVPVCGNSIPVSGNIVPVCGNSIPVSGNIVPVCGNSIPVSGNIVPVCGNSVPVSGNIIPVCGNSVPVSSMKLCLHSGNAFPMSSSSSSSSSSFCPGDSSPESLRSLSSLSGGRTDSPLDYDLLEVTLMATVMGAPDQTGDVVVSKWLLEEKNKKQDHNGDVSVGKIQTEPPESNDNSVSFYLDANSSEYHTDNWNQNQNQNLTVASNTCESAPDSTTEIFPEEFTDEEDEALFLSVSSDVGAWRSSATRTNMNEDVRMSTAHERRTEGVRKDECTLNEECQTEGVQTEGVMKSEHTNNEELSTGRFQRLEGNKAGEELKESVLAPWPSASEDLLQIPSAGPGSLQAVQRSAVSSSLPDAHTRQTKPKLTTVSKPSVSNGIKASSQETNRVSKVDLKSVKVDLKSVKAKVGPRSTPSPMKTHNQKLGPDPRPHGPHAPHGPHGPYGKGTRVEKGASRPGLPTGPPGHHGPRQTHADRSVSGDSGGSPTRPRLSQGVSKPRSTSGISSPCVSKPSANQQTSSGSAGQPAAAAASKLPIKGLPTILGSSSLGNNTHEKNGVISKGLKAPPTNSIASKMTAAAANQTTAKTAVGGAKQTSQKPLQRSSSAHLSRLNTTVNTNKPRQVLSRAAHGSSLQGSGTKQNHNQDQDQQKQPDLVTDVVKVNGSVMLVSRGSDPTDLASAGASTPGFRIKSGTQSNPKPGSRLHSGSRSSGSRSSGSRSSGSRFSATAACSADNSVSAKEQAEKKNQALNQLRKFLVQGNKRVEALATVIQHLFSEQEEALKQKQELSVELANLRQELGLSSQSCVRLQKEKEEVRSSLEEELRRLEEQHQEEVEQLEDRLRSFYQTEWDKVHQMYQEEADKYRMLMEQQVEELRTRQEAERKNQEVTHLQRVESLKLEYEMSIQELKGAQQTALQNLEQALKDTHSSLSEQISELSAEKEVLTHRLNTEEEKRSSLQRDQSLKDSHSLYLEQELDSLKVVLEMKNKQLHEKDKKLIDMDKLVQTNVKLEEDLKKVQQENEDYKARMDRQAALSKQLSNEQALLQQTLQKESKVNKRLSMENEELLWKLHNGDLLASPRHLGPTPPCSAPQDSASFPTAAPLSPR
ncbi:uncharacterized protein LOC115416314 isoform X2 [Sphaeramia orbicularis]|uniref:uncharacterized protein LOC115416314 isoform X2 n=1 Tax=Sphaeramia orbicularis TaxID=375764 RepID=UPI0011801D6C|nr:uncharacterized protein LOC115416314 isoform X2 [Sphaeramia orbicularis]